MPDVAKGSVLLTPKFDNLSGSIAEQLSGAFDGASKVGAKAGSETGSKYSSTFSAKAGAIAGVVSSVTSSAINAISSSLGSAINRVDTMNNFPKVMQNLGYSGDEATVSIKKMSGAIDGLPTSLPALTGMVQQLAPLSSNLDEATNIGIAFNDMCLASGASAADVSRAMQQYSQILSKGKPELQDWRTLQEVMPGQLNQMATALLGAGSSSMDLYKALKDGTISMSDFNSMMMTLDKEGGDSFASFAQQAKDSTQGIGTAIDNIGNRVSKAVQLVIDAIGAENISGAINSFTSQFSVIGGAIATIVGGAKEVISTGVDAIKGAFSGIADALPTGALDSLKAAFETIAPAVAAAVGAFALMLPVVAGIAKIAAAAGGIKALGAALVAVAGGPVGLAIAGIVAVVAALAALYNTNEDVKNAVDGAWQKIQGAVSAASDFIGGVIEQVWPYVEQAISTAMETAQEFVETAWPIIQNAFSTACTAIQGIVDAAWPLIQSIIMTVMGAVETFIQDVWPTITNCISAACAVISAVVQAAWPAIEYIVGGVMLAIQTVVGVVWPIVQAAFATACAFIGGIINTVWPVIQSIITTVMTAINDVITIVLAAINGDWTAVWNGIGALILDVWNGILSVVTTAIDAVLSAIVSVLGSVISAWTGAWESVQQALADAWAGIQQGVSDGIQGVMDGLTSLYDGIIGFFSGAGEWLVGSGEALLNGLKDGVMNALGSVTDSISQALEGIRALFPFSPAKKGPFSGHGYTTYSGRALMGDFGGAIVATAPKVAARAASAMSAVHDALGAAALGVPPTVGVGVGSVRTARAAVGVAGGADESGELVIAWLAANLPSIIEEFTPVMGEKEFGRKARKAVAYA